MGRRRGKQKLGGQECGDLVQGVKVDLEAAGNQHNELRITGWQEE